MRFVFPVLFLVLGLSIVVSCSKEKSFEVDAPGTGSLRSDGNGDCLPKTAVGSFIAGTALTDSNYLEIEIDVASEGSYAIRTDTVNGYSFSGIGNFNQTGINRIRLAGSGTPVADGQDAFTVIFDTSFCFVPVTVQPAGSVSGPASFTLQGSGDTCMISAVSGDYIQNTPLSAASKVEIRINATAPGTYSVTTNTVNEFSFSGSGTIAAAGEQTITLLASGTPATEGASEFTVTAGGTTCTFSVNVTASDVPPPVATGDLFPLTPDSRWSYLYDLATPNDTIEVTNIGATTIEETTYQNFEYKKGGELIDNLFYRREGDNYLQYMDVNKLIPELENDVQGEVTILKENLAKDDTWTTDFPAELNGADITLRFASTCTEANSTATVNSKSYSGVYKVTTKIQSGIAGVFTDAGPVIETYYAKGIGLIYEKGNEQGGNFERFLKYYEIK